MKRYVYIWSTLFLALAMNACGQGKQSNTYSPPGVPGITPYASATPYGTATPSGSPLPTPPAVSGGATASLVISGSTVADQTNLLKNYVGASLNTPGPVQININARANSGVYLGTSKIRFYDQQGSNLVLHTGSFYNGTSPNSGNNVHIQTVDSTTGEIAYRLMFEDYWGVIVVVLKYASAANDPANMIGKVWFRNFGTNANPLYDYWDGYQNWPANPLAFCWSGVVNTGPFDCRNLSTPPAESGSKAFTFLGTIPYIDGRQALGL